MAPARRAGGRRFDSHRCRQWDQRGEGKTFEHSGTSAKQTMAIDRAQFSGESLWGEMIADDLPSLGLKFDLPVVFIQGAEDRGDAFRNALDQRVRPFAQTPVR